MKLFRLLPLVLLFAVRAIAAPTATDNFADSNGTNPTSRAMSTGQNWTSITAGFLTNGSGRAYPTATNSTYIMSADLSQADYTVAVNLYTASLLNGEEVGIEGRANSGNTTYYFTRWTRDSSNVQTLELYRIGSGAGTALLGSVTLSGGDLKTASSTELLELVMIGSAISVNWKGSQKIAVTDANITAAGRAGIQSGISQTTTTGTQFEDFNVTFPTTYTSYAPTNSNLYFSPYNSDGNGSGTIASNNVLPSSTYVEWNARGAYLKFKVTIVTAGDVRLLLDTTTQNGITTNAAEIAYKRDASTSWSTYKLVYSASEVEQNLATSLSAGTYEFNVYYKGSAIDNATYSTGGGEANFWTGTNVVRIKGVKIPSDASLSASTIRTKRTLIYGDSLSAGYYILGTSDASTSHDAGLSWVPQAMFAIDSEYGVIPYGGQGFDKGQGNVTASSTHPSLYNSTAANQSWDKYSSGRSRITVTGQPQPDYVIIEHGANDTASVSASLAALLTAQRAQWATAKIFVLANNFRSRVSELSSGEASGGDANTYFVDWPYANSTSLYTQGSPSVYSGDGATGGGHPSQQGAPFLATSFVKGIQAALGGSGGSRGFAY